jgi:hypothetical protein
MKGTLLLLLFLVFPYCAKAREREEVNALLKRTFYYEFSSTIRYIGQYEPRTDSIAFVLIQDRPYPIKIYGGDTMRMAYYGQKEEGKLYDRLLKGDSIRKAYIDFPVYFDHPLIYRDTTCFAKFDLENCYITSLSRGYGRLLDEENGIINKRVKSTQDVLLNNCHIGKLRLNKISFERNIKIIQCTFNSEIYFSDIVGLGQFVVYLPQQARNETQKMGEVSSEGVLLVNIKTYVCELSFFNVSYVGLYEIKSTYLYLLFHDLKKRNRIRLISSKFSKTGKSDQLPTLQDVKCDSNFVIDGNMRGMEYKNIQVGYQLADSARKSLKGFVQELKVNKELRVVAPYGRTYAGSLFRPDQQLFIQPIYYNQSDEPSWLNSDKFIQQKRGLSLAIRAELLQYSNINVLGLRDEILAVESRKDLLQNERDNISQRYLYFFDEVVRDSLSKKNKTLSEWQEYVGLNIRYFTVNHGYQGVGKFTRVVLIVVLMFAVYFMIFQRYRIRQYVNTSEFIPYQIKPTVLGVRKKTTEWISDFLRCLWFSFVVLVNPRWPSKYFRFPSGLIVVIFAEWATGIYLIFLFVVYILARYPFIKAFLAL